MKPMNKPTQNKPESMHKDKLGDMFTKFAEDLGIKFVDATPKRDGQVSPQGQVSPANTTDTTKGLIDTYGHAFTDLGKNSMHSVPYGIEQIVVMGGSKQDKVEDWKWETELELLWSIGDNINTGWLKVFIKQTLSSQRQDLIEKIEKLGTVYKEDDESFVAKAWAVAYNSAIKEVIELIKNK